MALIRNIVKSILPPEDTAEMWLDGEGKLRAYSLGVWKEVSATEVNSEEVIAASQSYPYNLQIGGVNVKSFCFEGDLSIIYDLYSISNMRLFSDDSFLANHVKKVNIMGNDIEDIASLPDILEMIKGTYGTTRVIVRFTLDTDTIEGDLFGINYIEDVGSPKPIDIRVNCKVKSLDCSHISNPNLTNFLVVSILNSPTEILEQGSIKGRFGQFILPLALKNLEQNAFAKYSTTEGGEERDCEVAYLIMPSLTVPESLPQSLNLSQIMEGLAMLCFPALVGERTYKDYVRDVFNIDVTTEEGAAKVYCINILSNEKEEFKSQT